MRFQLICPKKCRFYHYQNGFSAAITAIDWLSTRERDYVIRNLDKTFPYTTNFEWYFYPIQCDYFQKLYLICSYIFVLHFQNKTSTFAHVWFAFYSSNIKLQYKIFHKMSRAEVEVEVGKMNEIKKKQAKQSSDNNEQTKYDRIQ